MSPTQPAAQYITFRLGEEYFAIPVAQVREVLDLSQITKVPTAPAYLRGVVNVRGSAIPVVDLRLKFGLPRRDDSVHTRILVLELVLDGEATVLGGLADSVHEVIELAPAQISPPPKIAQRWRSECIQGMGKQGEHFIMLFDVAAVFSAQDIAVVASAATDATLAV